MPKYLDPNILAALGNMELIARILVRGLYAGLHRSPYYGTSVEFAEHRPYTQGDETRHIDWKLFARTDRFTIKRYEVERNLRCTVVLDVSGSMGFSSRGLSKLEYASYLAAASAYLMIRQRDAAGLTTFDTDVRAHIRSKGTRRHLFSILAGLEQLSPGGETRVGQALHHLAERIPRKGMVLLISDLFDEPEAIVDGLRHLRFCGHEVLVFHVLDDFEIDFPARELLSFRDLETGETVPADAKAIGDGVRRDVAGFIASIRQGCWRCRVDHVLARTSMPVEQLLFEYLAKRLRL